MVNPNTKIGLVLRDLGRRIKDKVEAKGVSLEMASFEILEFIKETEGLGDEELLAEVAVHIGRTQAKEAMRMREEWRDSMKLMEDLCPN